jgi:hypothetical protein|tara:strand:+ start:1258 stop:1866 length:609 start_codon:yes stop_codon:yes gene_type:complete
MGLISNGTTIFDAGTMSVGGSMTFIKKLTASSSSTLQFVDGSSSVVLDSTYKEYVFILKSLHISGSNDNIQINFSTDGGSNYNVTKTTTLFRAINHESDATSSISYQTGGDLAQSTAGQRLTKNMQDNNDDALSGIVRLFNPSSTTFVKQFMTQTSSTTYHPYIFHDFVAGYGNTTSAIDAVQFEPSSGTIDSGTITLYGIS